MNFKGSYDFGNLATLKNYTEVEGFQPRFDNCLALTAYNDQQILVLTLTGQLLLVKNSLSACLKQLCQHYRIYSYEMDVYYRLAECRTQGLIAGNYRLVPSQGTSNPHVVYYNAHFIDSKTYSKERHRVLLTMDNGQGDFFQLYIDASYRSFVRILSAAERVSKYQLQKVEVEMRRLGMVKATPGWQGSQEVFQYQRDTDQFNDWLYSTLILAVVTAAFENSYGEKPDASFSESVYNVLMMVGRKSRAFIKKR